MAKKFESFRLDEKKHAIILYTNAAPSVIEEEKPLRDYYLNNGWFPMKEEKKKTTVEMMRSHFENDKEALAEFNRLYALKENEITEVGKNGKKKTGFHLAAKYHADYVKAHKQKKQK